MNSGVVIGDLRIRNVEESNRNGFVWRKFEVTCAGEVRFVTHYHYIAWPDHGVPRELGTLAGFLNETIQEERKEGPIIVHCSAGVGRTGTLIALSHLKQTIEAQKSLRIDLGISVFSVVRRLREQRNYMVQSKEQYELLYNFVNEWLR
jgi:protein tyrosine phosphatase